MTRGCPHEKIVHCPLYWAAHGAKNGGRSCDDGRLNEGGCGVNRGIDYDRAVSALRLRDLALVFKCETYAEVDRIRAQRQRNMRAAGIQ